MRSLNESTNLVDTPYTSRSPEAQISLTPSTKFKRLFIFLLAICGITFLIHGIYWFAKTSYVPDVGYPIPRYTYKSPELIAGCKISEQEALKHFNVSPVWDWTIEKLRLENGKVKKVLQSVDMVKPSRIAVVTMIAGTRKFKELPAFSTFKAYSQFALQNMAMYTHKHGYPFFFETRHLVDEDKHSLFWGKLDLMNYYLRVAGFEWVLWSDIDVLFMDFDIMLQTFLAQAGKQYHLISILEGGHEWPKEDHGSSMRSGFFFIRNSPEGLAFLDHWSLLHGTFHRSTTPEQDALEHMIRTDSKWRNMALMFPSWVLHTYCESYERGSFTVHFPNTERKWFLPEWYKLAPRIDTDFELRLQFSA